jgi:hypothetical protein
MALDCVGIPIMTPIIRLASMCLHKGSYTTANFYKIKMDQEKARFTEEYNLLGYDGARSGKMSPGVTSQKIIF